jgi:prevent-host-death family protein
MKAETYSTYEAKARFSEILRKVRKNTRIVITNRGKPVAEIGPITCAAETLEHHLADLEDKGIVSRGNKAAFKAITSIARRTGALQRFLDERD